MVAIRVQVVNAQRHHPETQKLSHIYIFEYFGNHESAKRGAAIPHKLCSIHHTHHIQAAFVVGQQDLRRPYNQRLHQQLIAAVGGVVRGGGRRRRHRRESAPRAR